MTGYNFDRTILREYDIRGVVGETLSAEDARAIGRAFGTIVARKGGTRVCVGYDGRLSSPELEAALVAGLSASGVTAVRVGRGPTPMLYFATYELDADGGIMITGSHNPSNYNGFKIMLGKKSFFGEEIQAMSRLAAAGDFESGAGQAEDHPIFDAYVKRLLKDLDMGDKALSIAWDAGNGAAGEVMAELCKKVPGQHRLLNEVIDGTFPAHHPDPTVPENLVQLQEAVAEGNCDLGIAFDGDGDRIGLIDGQGRILWGDQIMLLLARDVLRELPGSTIIADVKASQVLFDEVARAGGKPVMWKTGHSLIKTKMIETNAPFAGEMSAHLFFADRFYGFDDALYAAVRLLNIVSRSSETLAEYRDSLPQVVNTPEIRFPCSEDRKVPVISEVKSRLAANGADVNDIDGVRVRTEDGWWLLRASNTQDVLVARCEANDEAGLSRLKQAVATQISASGLDVPDF
ncbi:phosphoglucomutase/phosphomannomutase PgmG [Denitrobaculum tricleocarpae]|uniref:Phosphomannomutase/phosphoglucomutase n=1 Tax=Denitrobaculum tricleocarpae TaxID=2591009 RepID=A0A545TXY0_9PROT|nr:phosphomannomutase/phosphoglucomutase [Denitrobaculum tricleocarpae]TQV82069.1 phosphomannomutase/phosphoglucomutase [Denitrobaculum tricleocarpae]